MKIGDRVYVHGYVDKILKDTVTIRNAGGYFRTVKSEIIEAEHVRHGKWVIEEGHVCCSECGEISKEYNYCPYCGARMDKE